jgi:hypothetical protein
VAAATAAAIAATAAAAAATTTTAVLALFGFIHLERAAVDDGTVHGLDGFLRGLGRSHRDEAKAPGSTGLPIHHEVHVRHLTVRRELRAQSIRVGVEREIADVKTLTHELTYFSFLTAE